MQLEAYEFQEFLEEWKVLVSEKIPYLEFDVDYYKIYEEEYGGFCHYGVLKINIDNLSKKDMLYIKKSISISCA